MVWSVNFWYFNFRRLSCGFIWHGSWFFDTVFLRFGNYHDAKGQISGLTYGYGLKLNALDYGFIEYNYAKYPGGEIQNTQMKWDISAGINLQLF